MEYEGSRHLVDIGGYPMFEALSLLDLPKVYVYTGRQVMFTKSSAKGRYIRWHSKKDVVVAKEVCHSLLPLNQSFDCCCQTLSHKITK